jgi:hypothetical protein
MRTVVALGMVVAGIATSLLAGGAAEASGASQPFGLEVAGNHLTTLDGRTTVRLLGVNRSGAEYECVFPGDRTVFAGPTGPKSIRAIESWHVDAVRVPLNEDCWLGINGAVPSLSGAVYRRAIARYVAALTAAHLYVVLDLHWAAPGRILADEQWPMADADHAPTFWKSVASTFGTNRAVLFDLFNEPFITSWSCWLDGCRTRFDDSAGRDASYRTAGMQQLLDAVRSTGARNVVLLGGLAYANDESGWASHEPRDPDHQLAVSFHEYQFNICGSSSCWDATIAPLAATTPVVTGEFGESGCRDSFDLGYMRWADTHGISYLGWAWDSTESGWSCSAGPALITNYDGAPTAYGVGLKDHLAVLAGA